MTVAAPNLLSDPQSVGGRLDVVIVNYETPGLLDANLRSIVDPTSASVREVIVVDNSATADDAERVVGKYPGVRLIRPQSNIGYGRAANEGIAAGIGEYALVLNADAHLHAGAVEALVGELDQHAQAGIVGPRLVDQHGRVQPSCARFPTPGRVLLHETGLWKILRSTRFGDATRPFFDLSEPGAVPWVLGAALAIRRRDFDAVGGFDPGYFMYYEEVDLCRRLAARGALTRFTPAATVGHIGGASTAQEQAPMQREMFRSLARYVRRHGRDPGLLRLRLSVIAIALGSSARGLVTRSNGRGHSTVPGSSRWGSILVDAVRGWPDE